MNFRNRQKRAKAKSGRKRPDSRFAPAHVARRLVLTAVIGALTVAGAGATQAAHAAFSGQGGERGTPHHPHTHRSRRLALLPSPRPLSTGSGATASALPASGPGGSRATISGSGFAPNETVRLMWNCPSASCGSTYVDGTTTTDGTGTWSDTITVPNVKPNTYQIGVFGETSGLFTTASFTIPVPPPFSVSPSSGPVLSSVTFSGSNFQPGGTVSIQWSCGAPTCTYHYVVGTATADSTGAWTDTARVPNVKPNVTYRIGVFGESSGLFTTTLFTVPTPPTVGANPSSGAALSRVTFSGSQYAPGETVRIVWSCPSPACALQYVAGTATADSTGAWSDAVTVPGVKPNVTYPIGMFGETSGRFATTSYTVLPIMAAAGDIACAPGSQVTSTSCQQQATSNLLRSRPFSAILTLGDNQYNSGTLSEFQNSFDPSWGRVKSVIHAVPGNHEYNTSGAAGYFSYFGSAAGDPSTGYYSFNVGSWHIIALNAECTQVGGCQQGSAEEQWLQADLAAHPGVCTLAYWHEPRFSAAADGDDSTYQAFWQDLYDAHADVVLNGHSHVYERFAQQDPVGNADPNGVREFVVGTGGENHMQFYGTDANTEARNDTSFGILEMTLHPNSYDWQFVPAAGSSYTDSGSTACHN